MHKQSEGKCECEPAESLTARVLQELYRDAVLACVRVSVFAVLLVLLFFVGPCCCVCLWGIMAVCIVLMLVFSFHSLWMVALASFVVTFWAGCQAETTWLVVNTHFSVR
jgi:hypothetical protein